MSTQSPRDIANGPRLRRMLADAESGRLDKALNAPPHAAGRFRIGGRSYNRAVSEPLFRHYISGDLETFEREYFAFARDLAGLR